MRGGRGEVPAPLFMGTGRVQLAISPRTFLVTPARIVRARSTRLQRLRPHDPPHRGPQGGNCPRRDRVRLLARDSRRHATFKRTQVLLRRDSS